jgi:transitional endoplasmic reticulum ATPase
LREIFRKARQAAPAIIFFDEIDALVPTRGGGLSTDPVADRVLSQFLSEFDGIEELKGVLVLGATNRLDRLDPAVLRPGRFDEIIEIPPPGEADRKAILEVHLRDTSIAPQVNLDHLARDTGGYSGAELASLCRRAGLSAVRRVVRGLADNPDSHEKVRIEPDDIAAHLIDQSLA